MELRRCSMCHQMLPVDDFALRAKATGKRQSWCRACHKAWYQAWWLVNGARTNESRRANRREKRSE